MSIEWSKDKTLKLIELLQVNASVWNPSICDTRRDKQKRKEELRNIADILAISISDATKKIQHLRTQYNRESGREARANAEDPNDRYISNWYAFEYLHFLKDSTKPYRVLQTDESTTDANSSLQSHTDSSMVDCKLSSLSPQLKIPRPDNVHTMKTELVYPIPPRNRDEFTVFGEYVANELRSLKGEKNLLVAKKKIQDVIFEMKMDLIADTRETLSPYTVYTSNRNSASPNVKLYTTPAISTSLETPVAPPSTMGEIIINSACHYSNFKVSSQ